VDDRTKKQRWRTPSRSCFRSTGPSHSAGDDRGDGLWNAVTAFRQGSVPKVIGDGIVDDEAAAIEGGAADSRT
jgi:hypothetical protein